MQGWGLDWLLKEKVLPTWFNLLGGSAYRSGWQPICRAGFGGDRTRAEARGTGLLTIVNAEGKATNDLVSTVSAAPGKVLVG